VPPTAERVDAIRRRQWREEPATIYAHERWGAFPSSHSLTCEALLAVATIHRKGHCLAPPDTNLFPAASAFPERPFTYSFEGHLNLAEELAPMCALLEQQFPREIHDRVVAEILWVVFL
jgi:hypothetical protein